MCRKPVLYLFTIVLISAGCIEKADKKIVVWTSTRPVEREAVQTRMNTFAKNYPGYRFILLFYAPEELRTNYIVSALAGKGPALVHCASDFIGPFSELEVIRPMEDLFSETFLDSFIVDPVPANTVFRGHLYQIADRVGNHLCLVYNKKYLEKPPATFAQLIDWGKRFVQEKGSGYYALAWNYTEPAFAVPFIGGYGGWIIDDRFHPTLDTEPVIKAARLIYDLANRDKIMPAECDYETANALFLDGRAAMIINGPWSWGTYINSGMNIGLARIPKIDETGLWPTPTVFPMGYCMNINLTRDEAEIAAGLIGYLTAPDIQLEFARKYNLLPSRKSVLADSSLWQNPLFRGAMEQMMVGRPMPVNTEMRWIWDAMRPAYQGIFTNQITPEKAGGAMQSLAEKLIEENRN